MTDGWIKLHLSTIDNDIWRDDKVAWQIFEYLCLMAYKGKPQGTMVTSRYKIANATNGNNNTVYKALTRLRNAKMVTSVATSKKTTITICNWSKYQVVGNQSGNNKVTTEQQQSNTLIRIKNKDIRNNTNVEVQRTYDLYLQLFNKNQNQYKLTEKRKAKIKQRLSDAGEAMTTQALRNVSETPFYCGDNDRGWCADLDFIIRSYEQVERLSALSSETKIPSVEEALNNAKW